ncbi:glycine-rich cell wall structural protein-like [Capsicum annuum]|uniref:glycine-rich cell wall structural protein-like n=1 Tax=Capsicum annuum TaxID=4072 RepID=UPI001FB0D023|nr:glycine-rich cell wall structural protein-like [Capsicum annuum]
MVKSWRRNCVLLLRINLERKTLLFYALDESEVLCFVLIYLGIAEWDLRCVGIDRVSSCLGGGGGALGCCVGGVGIGVGSGGCIGSLGVGVGGIGGGIGINCVGDLGGGGGVLGGCVGGYGIGGGDVVDVGGSHVVVAASRDDEHVDA